MTEAHTSEKRTRFARIGWRSAAIASAAAATGILALVVLSEPAPPGARFTVGDAMPPSTVVAVDPLRAELARCTSLPANADDAGCRAAWEVNRRRFMGESRSFVVPEPPPIEPAPPSAGGVAVPPVHPSVLER